MACWMYRPEVTVGTVEGYAKQYNEDPAQAVEQCLANHKKNPYAGHCLAWTNAAPSILTADYKGKAEAMDATRVAYENATLLEDAEIVEIEGRLYKVHNLCPCAHVRYSDPVKFIPVK